MSRRRPPAPPPGRAALATAVREAYPHGVAAVVAVVDAAFAALEARLTPRMVALEAEVAALRRRVAADSTTSSKPPSTKPPSTDLGRAVRPVSLREASGRSPGAQRGHPGATLTWRAAPDVVVAHRPGACAGCGRALPADGAGAVVDLPPVALVTTEHRRVAVACAHCGHATAGALPPGVLVGVQYGAEVKALAVALHSYHLLPYGRTAECLHALLGTGPSPGTLARWTRAAAAALAPAQRAAAHAIGRSATAHADETTLHVAATATHTHYHVHRRRGREGIAPGGVWDAFTGTLVHDAWWANFHLGASGTRHQLCLAHLRREAEGLYALTQELRRPERWLQVVDALLGRLHWLVRRAAAAGRSALAPGTRRQLAARYDALLRTALRRHPYPPSRAVATRARAGRSAAGSRPSPTGCSRIARRCCAARATRASRPTTIRPNATSGWRSWPTRSRAASGAWPARTPSPPRAAPSRPPASRAAPRSPYSGTPSPHR